jgi:hypothetical protein
VARGFGRFSAAAVNKTAQRRQSIIDNFLRGTQHIITQTFKHGVPGSRILLANDILGIFFHALRFQLKSELPVSPFF